MDTQEQNRITSDLKATLLTAAVDSVALAIAAAILGIGSALLNHYVFAIFMVIVSVMNIGNAHQRYQLAKKQE
jgi:hypothetical protein